MPGTNADTLIVLNDSSLERLIRARGDAADGEIERMILRAQPLIKSILSRQSRNGTALGRHDREDVLGTINLRLLVRLRAIASSEDDAVRDFESYVASITYNAIADYLRKAFPARARLKNRLRYALAHDQRLALWSHDGALVCGLQEWTGMRSAAIVVPNIAGGGALQLTAGGDRPGDALLEIFRQLSQPVQFDAVIAFLADRWGIREAPSSYSDPKLQGRPADPVAHLEMRHYLGQLWREICELRPMQRKALLFNLRGGDPVNVIALVVLTGTASHEKVAAVLEISPGELAAIWNSLPLDDLKIASRLQVTRQQVINLRKSARARLSRRMSGK